MNEHYDQIREKSGAFYSTQTMQSNTENPSDGLRQHNLALRDTLSAIIDRNNFDLLDIGCGRGRICRIIRDVFPQSRISGIDISAEQIERARSFLSDAVFEIGNEISFPFSDNSFDYATCRMSIHHYPDMINHLREVKRVLRPGGYYLVIDPVPSPGLQDYWLNKVFLDAEHETSGDGHIKFYTLEEYSHFLAELGLTMARRELLPHSVTWSKATDYNMSIYNSILSAPDEFRIAINFADEGDHYRYDLPTQVLGILKPEQE